MSGKVEGFRLARKFPLTKIDGGESLGTNQLGVSKFVLRLIEVVSTSPPGRENDPAAAAAKADEDRLKELQDQRQAAEGE